MPSSFWELCQRFCKEEQAIRMAEQQRAVERQHPLGRMTARERLVHLFDEGSTSIEMGLWAGYEMYEEWGGAPSAALICAIGWVEGRRCLVMANDATVKAGALFPLSIKKLLRGQEIARRCKLPLLYLVDSAGVFLPLQDEVFPDDRHLGRLLHTTSLLAQEGIPQIAAIMGDAIGGSAYLPLLCDQLLMTKQSSLCVGGPALVEAAIGQRVSLGQLGGAHLHARMNGIIDFVTEDDASCLEQLRRLVSLLPAAVEQKPPAIALEPKAPVETIYQLLSADNSQAYDVEQLLACLIDSDSDLIYKSDYGKSLYCLYARIQGWPVAIVASQRLASKSYSGELQVGGVLYAESAEKAAAFIEEADRLRMPLLFLQDVSGFMVGKRAEESAILRSGARLLEALSASRVAKLTLIIGNSFGAAHYALCGRAYDPLFLASWPNGRYGVMGSEQAADTLVSLAPPSLKESQKESIRQHWYESYLRQTDIRYAAARGWVDAIVYPASTRSLLADLLQLSHRIEPLAPS